MHVITDSRESDESGHIDKEYLQKSAAVDLLTIQIAMDLLQKNLQKPDKKSDEMFIPLKTFAVQRPSLTAMKNIAYAAQAECPDMNERCEFFESWALQW